MTKPGLLLPASRDIPSSLIRRISDGVLNLLYPESCFVCGSPVSRAVECGLCPACWDKALQQRIAGPVCPSCGLPFQSFDEGTVHLCGRCTIALPPFSGARSFGCYRSELSRIIQALKFDGRQNVARLLGPLLASTFLESWSPQEIDVVVPVPLHPRRRRERGYNQAALLGHPLARIIGLRFCNRALQRARDTMPQVGLTNLERAQNLKHAFQCPHPALIQGARVLLIDDVMTTGSTVASASSALLEAGAMRVSVLTVARAVGGME